MLTKLVACESIGMSQYVNICDNCKLYNPRQLDENNNKIWDKCEKENAYLLANDKDKDKILDNLDNVNIAELFGSLLNAVEHRGQFHSFTLNGK